MFFHVSKLFWAIAVPSTFLTLVALLGIVLMFRFRRIGTVLACVGVIGLVVVGFGPFGRALLVPIENRFPVFMDDGRPVDGVIVLGGAEISTITEARGQPAFQESGERIMALADLARRYPQARIVFTGGSGSLFPVGGVSESDVVRLALPQLGIDPSRVIFEGKSRNTAENAAFSRAMLDPKPGERWLLVTSAFHMPRAMGCFRVAGFPVVAYPVDFRTDGKPGWTRPFSSIAEGLGFIDVAMREWIGLVVYYATGRTDALLPAP